MYFSSQPPSSQPPVVKTGIAVTGSPGAIFTASGRIVLWSLVGSVTTVVGAVATTLLWRANPTTGSDTDLCAAAAVTSAPVGSLFGLTGLVTDVLQVNLTTQGALANMSTPLIIQPGTLDLIVVSGGTTGALTWTALWDPVDPAAVLT